MSKYRKIKSFSQKEINQIIELYASPFCSLSDLTKKFNVSCHHIIEKILKNNNIELKSKSQVIGEAKIDMVLTQKNNLSFNGEKVYFNTKGDPFVFFQQHGKKRRKYLVLCKCCSCGKDIIVPRNKCDKHCCSKKCQNAMITKENNINWTGGVREKWNGYLMGYSPDHPNAVQKYVLIHRLVMEKEIRRFLERDEFVHHIDFDKKNNNIENLYLCKKQKHLDIHISVNGVISELIKKGVVTFDKEKGIYEIRN